MNPSVPGHIVKNRTSAEIYSGVLSDDTGMATARLRAPFIAVPPVDAVFSRSVYAYDMWRHKTVRQIRRSLHSRRCACLLLRSPIVRVPAQT